MMKWEGLCVPEGEAGAHRGNGAGAAPAGSFGSARDGRDGVVGVARREMGVVSANIPFAWAGAFLG
jgi:hypothetical protein